MFIVMNDASYCNPWTFYVFLMATSVDTATVFISSDSKDFSQL